MYMGGLLINKNYRYNFGRDTKKLILIYILLEPRWWFDGPLKIFGKRVGTRVVLPASSYEMPQVDAKQMSYLHRTKCVLPRRICAYSLA